MKAWKIIKIILLIPLLALFAFLIFRIMMLEDNRTLSEIYPTEAACKAYSEHGKGAFTTHRVADEIADDGYYGSYSLIYNESEKEAQITVRYNDSLMEKYLVGSTEEDYAWELRDSEGDVISFGEVLETAEKYQYNYQKVVFENVTFGERDVYLYLVCNACDYPDDECEGQMIHAERMGFGKYKLSREEIKELEK